MCTDGSASETGLAYYCLNQSVEIAIQSYKLDRGHVSDIGSHADKLAHGSGVVCVLNDDNISV